MKTASVWHTNTSPMAAEIAQNVNFIYYKKWKIARDWHIYTSPVAAELQK